MSTAAKTIGLLYPGEMGAAIAALFTARGLRVVTTLGHRGAQTANRCMAAGVTILPSLADVIRESDVLFSIVPPAAAQDVADACCELAHVAPADALFVDLNSVGPDLAISLSNQLKRHGVSFVDGAINGLAKNLATTCTLFLSGSRAADISDLFSGGMKTRLLGDLPGRASAMKMLLSGLSKGVCALFIETALTAHRHGMLHEMIEAYGKIYPGVMGIVERMLPTYPQHAARRADEMRELEQTAETAGIEPCMLAAARHVHELLAGADFSEAGQPAWTIPTVIEGLAAQDFLACAAQEVLAQEEPALRAVAVYPKFIETEKHNGK